MANFLLDALEGQKAPEALPPRPAPVGQAPGGNNVLLDALDAQQRGGQQQDFQPQGAPETSPWGTVIGQAFNPQRIKRTWGAAKWALGELPRWKDAEAAGVTSEQFQGELERRQQVEMGAPVPDTIGLPFSGDRLKIPGWMQSIRKWAHGSVKPPVDVPGAMRELGVEVPEDSFRARLAERGQAQFEEATAEIQRTAPTVNPHSAKYYTYNGLVAFLDMVPAVALSYATRNPGLGALMLGANVTATTYGEARTEGRLPEDARIDALVAGFAEMATEAIPIRVFITPAGKGQLIKKLAKAGLTEAAQEGLTEAINIAYGNGVLDEDTTLWEAVLQIMDSMVLGAGVGTAMGIAPEIFNRSPIGDDTVGDRAHPSGGSPGGDPNIPGGIPPTDDDPAPTLEELRESIAGGALRADVEEAAIERVSEILRGAEGQPLGEELFNLAPTLRGADARRERAARGEVLPEETTEFEEMGRKASRVQGRVSRNLEDPVDERLYSTVQRFVRDSRKVPEQASPQEWINILSSDPQTVKPAEVKAMKLFEWIQEQTGTITRQQLLEQIEKTRIKIRVDTKIARVGVKADLAEIERLRPQAVFTEGTVPDSDRNIRFRDIDDQPREVRLAHARHMGYTGDNLDFDEFLSQNYDAVDDSFEAFTTEAMKRAPVSIQTTPLWEIRDYGEGFVTTRLRGEGQLEQLTGDDSQIAEEVWENDRGKARIHTSVEEAKGSLRKYEIDALGIASEYPSNAEELFEEYELSGERVSRTMTKITIDAGDIDAEFAGEPEHTHGTWNVILWVRHNTRTDKDGNKIFFVEEVQSDWHREIRTKGIVGDPLNFEPDNIKYVRRDYGGPSTKWAAYAKGVDIVGYGTTKKEALISLKKGAKESQVEDAPFKKDKWQTLAAKRVMLVAAEQGFDKIGWTTGKQQQDRYDQSILSDLAAIGWRREGDGFRISGLDTKGKPRQITKNKAENKTELFLGDKEALRASVGDSVADAIIASKADEDNITAHFDHVEARDRVLLHARRNLNMISADQFRDAEGVGLKIKSAGFMTNYDRKILREFEKVAQETGKKAHKITVKSDDPKAPHSVWAVDVDPKFTEASAFSKAPDIIGTPMSKEDRIEARAKLKARLEEVGIDKDVGARVTKGLIIEGDPKEGVALGLFTTAIADRAAEVILKRAIAVAAVEGVSIDHTINHEIVHALRDLSVISNADWGVLKRRVLANKVRMREIEARYANLDRESQIEEAIADEFGEWVAQKKRLPSRIARIFENIKKFMRTFTEWAQEEDIFEAISSGAMTEQAKRVGRYNKINQLARARGVTRAVPWEEGSKPGSPDILLPHEGGGQLGVVPGYIMDSPDIIREALGPMQGYDLMSKAAKITPPKQQGWWDRETDNVLKWWASSKYGEPITVFFQPFTGLEGFKVLRSLLQGKIWRLDEIARKVRLAFSGLNEKETIAAMEFMTTKGATLTGVPAENAILIKRAKKIITGIGKKLIANGQMEDSRYLDAYLPQVYLIHMLEQRNAGLSTRGRASRQGYLIQRDPWLQQQETMRRVLMGQVQDPGYLASKAVIMPMRDQYIFEFLETIAANKDWVLPSSIIDFGNGRHASVTWVRQQAARLRRMADHLSPDDRKAAIKYAKRLEKAASKAMDPKVDMERYRQIPDSPGYGALRGMWVRKPIFDDLVGSFNMIEEDAPLIKKIFEEGGYSTEATKVWKVTHVALNPPTIARNIYSGIMAMIAYEGIPPWRIPDLLVNSIRQMMHGGRANAHARRFGIYGGTTYSAVEMASAERILISKSEFEKLGIGRKVWELSKQAFSYGPKFYAMLEVWMKIAVIEYRLQKGATPEEAYTAANRALFDYSEINPTIRYIRSTPLLGPFVTFAYRNIPALSRAMVKRPWGPVGVSLVTFYGMKMVFQAMAGMDDDEYDALRKTMARWLQDESGVVFLPVKDSRGQYQPFDLGHILPWGGVMDAAKNLTTLDKNEPMLGIKPFSALADMALGGGPLADIIAVWQTNRLPFSGDRLIDSAIPPNRQFESLWNWTVKMLAPPFVTKGGALSRVWQAFISKTVDKRTGEPKYTKAQAFLRLLGINIYPFDPKHSRQTNMYFLQDELDRRIKEYRDIGRNRSYGPEEKKRRLAEQRAMIEKQQDVIKRYVDESRLPGRLQ